MNKEIERKIDDLLDIIEDWNTIEDCRNDYCEAYPVIERRGKIYECIAKYIAINFDTKKLREEIMIEEL